MYWSPMIITFAFAMSRIKDKCIVISDHCFLALFLCQGATSCGSSTFRPTVLLFEVTFEYTDSEENIWCILWVLPTGIVSEGDFSKVRLNITSIANTVICDILLTRRVESSLLLVVAIQVSLV